MSAGYWNETTITALLAGAQPGQLLILDLFSEATPDWENTNGYYGHQWVWNLLHDYGGNQVSASRCEFDSRFSSSSAGPVW